MNKDQLLATSINLIDALDASRDAMRAELVRLRDALRQDYESTAEGRSELERIERVIAG